MPTELLVLGLGAGLTFAAMRVVQPLIRRVNALYAARAIEQTDPGFKNSLLSYLELRRHRDELPKAALAAVEARAVRDLSLEVGPGQVLSGLVRKIDKGARVLGVEDPDSLETTVAALAGGGAR